MVKINLKVLKVTKPIILQYNLYVSNVYLITKQLVVQINKIYNMDILI